MAEIIRTERSSVLWGTETLFGVPVTPVRRFGIHDTIVAPDDEPKWVPFFGVGSQSRDRDTILRGPHDLRGSIPDIRLQGFDDMTHLLGLVFGRRSVSGSVTQILEGDFPGIGFDGRIPSMTMQIGLRDTANAAPLVRNYLGGKINRATLSASEGEELRLSIEEMMFLEQRHNRSGVFGYDAAVTAATDPGINDAGRFVFSGATITFAGVPMVRLRRFSISIDNQLEYRYYLKPTGGAAKLQLPNDIVEGKRVYKLDAEVDIGDPSTDIVFFEFLRAEGAASTSSKTSGFQMVFTFTQQPSEGGHALVIVAGVTATTNHPGIVITSAKHNIPAPPAGLVPVTLSCDVNNLSLAYV